VIASGSAPTVTNSGTTAAAVFNFGIPAGAPGTNATNPNFTAAATTVAAGGSATASLSGTYPNLTVTFGIPTGATGATPTITIGTVTTLAAGVSATASFTGNALNLGIPVGATGATPALSNINPLAPSTTGAIGTATTAARADHQHPLQAGSLTLVGNVTVTETLLISLSLGVKRMTLPLAGIVTTDKLIAIPNGNPTTGCEMINVYPISAGNVSVGYFVPALGIGATYTIPVSVFRIS